MNKPLDFEQELERRKKIWSIERGESTHEEEVAKLFERYKKYHIAF